MDALERKLRAALLEQRRVDGDTLVLADAVLCAALAGARPLSHAERAALQSSPLTMRRLRELAAQRRSRGQAANDPVWSGSAGRLRAAAGGALTRLVTEDGFWTLHFIAADGVWRTVAQLDPAAPFAAGLLRSQAVVRVVDGRGATVLEGALDADGECEAAWPFASAPAEHFQQAGAHFLVQPVEQR